MYTNQKLHQIFVSPEMMTYYKKKCENLPEETLSTQISELLKFLILVGYFPGNIIFGKDIDEIWHLWIMQTRQYEELCKKLPGGFFRHHSSKDYPEKPPQIAPKQRAVIAGSDEPQPPSVGLSPALSEAATVASPSDPTSEDERQRRFVNPAERAEFLRKAERVISFFASYHANFGPVREEDIPYWPPLERMITRLGWSHIELNEFLAAQAHQGLTAPATAAQ